MSKALTHKGYAAQIEFDAEDKIFFGRIKGIDDIVTFHGETVEELVHAFEEALDDYLYTCEKIGRNPQKPCSGRLLLRVPPEVHCRAAMAAEAAGQSLNAWAAEALKRASESSAA
jgi:predicted HicB family RNase H-like nuclease